MRRTPSDCLLAVAVAAVVVGCGDDDAAPADTPPPWPPTPTLHTTSDGDDSSFCTTYPQIEATFETIGGATINETRANLAAVVDVTEQLEAEVPEEISTDWATVVDGIRQLRSMADQATDIDELRAAVSAIDAAEMDSAGRAVEQWSQANC